MPAETGAATFMLDCARSDGFIVAYGGELEIASSAKTIGRIIVAMSGGFVKPAIELISRTDLSLASSVGRGFKLFLLLISICGLGILFRIVLYSY